MSELEGGRNILLYRLYAAFNEPLFWGPVLITLLQDLAHMSLPSIYYQESVVLVLCVALDVPFGALADRVGRKTVMIVGRIFLLASAVVFALMTKPLHAWTANVLWAIGYTMQSGADSALLYDTLKWQGREAEYKRIEGSSIGYRMALMAVGSLCTGFLADLNLRLPPFVGLPFVAIPFIAALLMKEPPHLSGCGQLNQINILKEGVAFLRNSVEVRWMVGFAALLATTSKLWFFTYNPYFELVGLPIVYYGVVFFLLNIVAWVSSHYAYKVEQYVGEKNCIIGMMFCLVVPILIMSFAPLMPLAFLVLVQNLVRGFMRPFVGDFLNRHVTSAIRATVLSVQSSVANLTSILGLAVFGFITDMFNLLNALMILGAAVCVLGIISYLQYVRRVA